MARALITGTAGFIGMHLAERLLAEDWEVVGIDALTPGYDPAICHARLDRLTNVAGYLHDQRPIETPGALAELMARHKPEIVVHLAAKAGVRASIDDPRPYFDANLQGTFELLEAARDHPPKHMMLASTSSAYGANTEMPFVETMKADWPMSFYAATKKATEDLSHAQSHIHGLPISMLRFFTVYGPWGRPDLALFKFVDAMLAGREIDIYNHGRMFRDFTYIGDLTESLRRLIDAPPPPDPALALEGDSLSPVAPYRVINIGNSRKVPLMDFVEAIEAALGFEAKKNFMDMQQGDVPATWADTRLLEQLTGFRPDPEVRDGIAAFVGWFRDYYGR